MLVVCFQLRHSEGERCWWCAFSWSVVECRLSSGAGQEYKTWNCHDKILGCSSVVLAGTRMHDNKVSFSCYIMPGRCGVKN